jgi:cytochrome b6-f complex iron-sulfur subunit
MSTRREFIKGMAGASAAVCCGLGVTSLLESCASVSQIKAPIIGTKIEIDKALFIDKDFVVINNSKLPAPIYVHKSGDTYTASLMLCTHKQCELNVTGMTLSCPCHGAEFSNSGTLLQGPAETDLQNFKVSLNNTKIIIDLKK